MHEQREQEEAMARSLGLNSRKELYAELARREQEAFKLSQEQLRLNMAEQAQKLEDDRATAARADTKFKQEQLTRDAEIAARTGLAPGESLEPLTQFTSASDPSRVQTFRGEVPAAGRAPGIYMSYPGQSREEVYQSYQQQLADDELARKIGLENRGMVAEEGRLTLGQQQFEHTKVKDALLARKTEAEIKRLNAIVERIRQLPAPFSHAKALDTAWKVVQDSGDYAEMSALEATAAVDNIARLLEDSYATGRPITASATPMTDKPREPSSWDDEPKEEDQTDWLGKLDQMFKQTGEDPGTKPGQQQQEQPTELPGVEGQPNPKAMDPNVSLIDLIGANPDTQKKIQDAEMQRDMYRLEQETRHMIFLGIPEAEWPDEHKAFVDMLRHPEKLQGMQQQ